MPFLTQAERQFCYIGITEKKMETIGIIGVIFGLYWDNGKNMETASVKLIGLELT